MVSSNLDALTLLLMSKLTLCAVAVTILQFNPRSEADNPAENLFPVTAVRFCTRHENILLLLKHTLANVV